MKLSVALVILQLSVVMAVMVNTTDRPRLEDEEECGLTTGGQEECYFDCGILLDQAVSGQAVSNLSCLLNCFPEDPALPGHCIRSLLDDVIEKRACNVSYNPGFWGESQSCNISEDGYETIIAGSCSAKTEDLFQNSPACHKVVKEQPGLIFNTVTLLLGLSCTPEAGYFLLASPSPSLSRRKRLAPVMTVSVAEGYKTELNFTHTRHRYPWLCSLRTQGADPQHLCAVTLLSLPPRPTVIVGAAHCTYLCKDTDGRGVTLPSCCCVSTGQESCAGERDRCGSQPRTVEMDGEHADIVCGEWETGPASMESSGEKYNVVLPVKTIVRHESFDAAKEGPGAGSDIAVFHVNDTALVNHRAMGIHAACLPPKGRARPEVGVHAGWADPPSEQLLNQIATGYTQYRTDFFKLWHYKMDVLKECKDPITSPTYNVELEHPSNTYYPPGTICAKDVTRQSCFSTGQSGSPLMAEEESKPHRFYIEGILSFVRGCDTFNFGPTDSDRTEWQLLQLSENPATYTKLSCFLPWVAEQYGLTYEGDSDDEDCKVGRGEMKSSQPCRETVSNLAQTEKECIFPFYYRDKLYSQCVLFEQDGFVYPVFRCPVRNITMKKEGINHFILEEPNQLYCVNKKGELDPEMECLDFFKQVPFSTCKNDCPGVKTSGIIGAAAVPLTGAASGGLGLGLLPGTGGE